MRMLCPTCKVKYAPTSEELRRYGIPEDKVRRLYRANPQGCDACNSRGYRGRTGVYEFMPMTGNIRHLLVGRPSEDDIRKAAEGDGMKSLRREAIYKVVMGVTSLEEVDRAVGGSGS